MEQTVTHNKKGFTLIEALVALLLLSIVLLGLIPSFLSVYNLNLEMTTHDIAVEIAQELLEEARSQSLSNLIDSNSTISRRVNKTDVNFNVKQNVVDVFGGELKKVYIKVLWTYRGQPRSYNATTVVGGLNG
ncbi:MAG: prepilin-type N-terminal cleavage/methylation domain-containing protein [Thermodesulfobacteria bacterium]|nr:prepilin-type N-terminal cleavage/methylation domain-containing protein [Thermodesulfobacteriota bacterium]